MRKRITQISIGAGLVLAAIILGGCASGQQQTEVMNLRFLVEEVNNLGNSVDSLFGN